MDADKEVYAIYCDAWELKQLAAHHRAITRQIEEHATRRIFRDNVKRATDIKWLVDYARDHSAPHHKRRVEFLRLVKKASAAAGGRASVEVTQGEMYLLVNALYRHAGTLLRRSCRKASRSKDVDRGPYEACRKRARELHVLLDPSVALESEAKTETD